MLAKTKLISSIFFIIAIFSSNRSFSAQPQSVVVEAVSKGFGEKALSFVLGKQAKNPVLQFIGGSVAVRENS